MVKSISRFSRNVADAQKYVYELKELGYDTDKSGKLVPNEDAWIVRQIFSDYAAGLLPARIAKRLDEAGAKRLRCDKPFEISIIMKILHNELYVGDRLLQKEAPHHYLTKRPDPTEPYASYYISNDHKPIINRETWDRAKALLERRKSERQEGVHIREKTHFLYGKVFCADCGAPYRRRTMRRGEALVKAWNCAERQKGKQGNGCKNVIIREDELLKTITEKLGWDWGDAERFDADHFMTMVRRVEISVGGVMVELMESA